MSSSSPLHVSPNGCHLTLDPIRADKTFTLLARHLVDPLTLIQGHAQLIGRRTARAETDGDAALQARSVAAINLAVPRIMTSLEGCAKLIAMRAA